MRNMIKLKGNHQPSSHPLPPYAAQDIHDHYLPPHSVAYGLTPSAPQLSVSSSMGQPTSVGAGGLMSNLSALGLPTASSNLSSLPSKSVIQFLLFLMS